MTVRLGFGEGNVAPKAAPNPFRCTLYPNKIRLNQGYETIEKQWYNENADV